MRAQPRQQSQTLVSSQDWNLRRVAELHELQPPKYRAEITLIVRRIVGIVTGICALYLTVGAVESPCADHSRDGTSASNASMAQHGSSHHELPAGGSDQSCKSVAVPCCVAMTSCGTTITVGSNAAPAAFAIVGQIVPPFHLAQPLSHTAPPEPPPPKA